MPSYKANNLSWAIKEEAIMRPNFNKLFGLGLP